MAAERSAFSVRRQPIFVAIAVACIFALYLPIVTLVVYAFNSGGSLGGWTGFTLKWFAVAWENKQIRDSSLRSIQIALVAASLATVMAALAAIATTRTPAYRGLTLKYALINQPLIVPEIVTAVALLIVFARIKI